jgi:lipopolysaccharide assembly outer membrane protein LptD (OstA)
MREMNKRILSYLLVNLCVFLSFVPAFSAEETVKEPIQLLNSDFSELRIEEDNVMVNLVGDVVFKHGDLNLRSNRAVWYRTAGQVVFIDSVRIEDPDQILTADRVTYYRSSRQVVADGNVVLLSKKEDAKVTGGHGEYDRVEKLVVFTQSPSLILKPGKGDSSVVVRGQRMEYYVDERRGLAREQVHISKADMGASCDEAEWINSEQKIVLRGNPQAEKLNDRLSGQTMQMFIRDDKVNRIDVDGAARASHFEVVDSMSGEVKESFLASKKMIFFLEDEELREVRACGNASSTYHPRSSSGSGQRISYDKNEASGDTIDLFLSDQRLNEVLIKGGAIGKYAFAKENVGNGSGVEDTIDYSAEVIDYRIDEHLITLEELSNLKYGEISLSAGRIVYDTEERILVAEGVKTGDGEEETWKGLPVLQDGKDRIEGERMSYDLRSRRGKIKAGITSIQKGIYKGELLRKITDEVLLADKGIYTTCDFDEPHFHFYCRRMKIVAKDKVITKPVVLYIGHLPVAAIPYYVFPIKPGRHSGFLTFDLGSLEAGDRFIRNLGYYWAPSDFWDLTTAFDFYEGSGWVIKGGARYAKRYAMSGSVAGSYNRRSWWNLATLTKSRSNRWDLTFNHRHTLSPTLSLSASGTFLSDKDYWRDLNLDPVERRNRSLHSQASLSKRWETASATFALDHRWNMDTDDRTLSLPVISFTRTSLPLIPPRYSEGGGTERRWFNSIYYSFSSDLLNYQLRRKGEEDFDRKKFMVSDSRASLSAPQKLFGWLVLNPGFNAQETWYWIFKTNLSEAYPISGNSTARRGTYSASLSANTVLYGTFRPRIGKLEGIRHVMTPSASLAWQPEFTRKNEYLLYAGRGGSGAERKAMAFGLNNLFQIKTRSVRNGEEVERKLDLFYVNFSSGYNFLAKERKLSNLSTVLRSTAVRNLDLAASVIHDLHDQSGELRLLSPRWLTFSLDTRLNLRGTWEESAYLSQPERSPGLGEPEEPESEDYGVPGLQSRVSQSWSLNLSHRYSQARGGAKTHWISASLRLPLTRRWLLSYQNRYDFSEEKITEQTFEFYRDMHCWEGRITWIATGFREGYYFRINIKALPEVKIEKSRGGLREVFF